MLRDRALPLAVLVAALAGCSDVLGIHRLAGDAAPTPDAAAPDAEVVIDAAVGSDAAPLPDAAMPDGSDAATCNRSCGGNACVDGVCEPTTFVVQEPYIAGIALRNGYVYWTHEDPPEIRRAPVGGGPVELACPSTSTPWVVMTDSAGIYWLAINGGPAGSVLKCTSPPCATPTVLATSALGSDSPYNATSDASRIYWSAGGLAPGLRTVSKAGGSTATIASEGDSARGIILVQGVLYVTLCCGTRTGLYSVPATGGTPARLNGVMTGRLATYDNALYTAENHILYKVATTGGMTPIDTASATIDDFAGVAVDASGIYAYSPSLGGIVRVPLNGGSPVLLSRANGVIQITLDDAAVYWNENPSGFVDRAVKRVVK